VASIEIVDVIKADLDVGKLQGRNIEVPKTGSRIDGDTIFVVGWVLGRSSPATTVEIVHDGTVLQSAPIDVRRPDVAAAFPDESKAERSGFRTTLAVPNGDESELLVRAVLQGEDLVPLGVIRARQRRSAEEQKSENNVQDRSGPLVQERSGPLGRFFRRLSGQGGG
jgi:hypothetical protein